MKTTQKTILAILVIAILVVGYLLFNKLSTGGPASNPAPSGQNPGTSTPVYKAPTVSKATADVLKQLSTSASQSITPQQIKDYSDKVAAVAVTSPVLDVTGCTATPNVLKYNDKTTVTVQNKDTVAHTLTYGPSDKVVTLYSAPAQSVKSVTLNILSGPGIYGYLCDKQGPAGMLLVVASQ
ncbi:MAG: hypothetical protein WDN47_00365 [Candidatus Doudnabacteria bacterium]